MYLVIVPAGPVVVLDEQAVLEHHGRELYLLPGRQVVDSDAAASAARARGLTVRPVAGAPAPTTLEVVVEASPAVNDHAELDDLAEQLTLGGGWAGTMRELIAVADAGGLDVVGLEGIRRRADLVAEVLRRIELVTG